MCFRPTEISMKKCPNCGANNKPIAKECAQCGTLLADMKVDFDADQAALDAAIKSPNAPSAPGTPSGPNAPSAPSVPAAPKPPDA